LVLFQFVFLTIQENARFEGAKILTFSTFTSF
jgi:hypothetical protein